MSPYSRSALSPAARIGVTGGVGVALVAASVASAAPAAAADHVVRPGDTVSHLAVRYGTTTRAIVGANGLDARATIRVGQTLSIPASAAQTPAAAPTPASASATYTVASGDTVSSIAARFGTSVGTIVAANGLDARAFIRAGQVLTIPSPVGTATTPATTAQATAPGAYTVVKGDTVSSIAARFGTSVAAIVATNGLDARASIRIGQTLTVPGAAVTSTSNPVETSVGSTFAGRTYPKDTVTAANQNKATLVASGAPSRAQMQQLVVDTALAMGVDPALAQAVAFQESGFDHTAVSPANAIGTMQVIPTSGQWASDLVGRKLDLLDPNDNVVAGVAILKSLLRSTGDRSTAIAGYYQGLASVRKYGMFADTRRYVANVQTLMSRFA